MGAPKLDEKEIQAASEAEAPPEKTESTPSQKESDPAKRAAAKKKRLSRLDGLVLRDGFS